MIGSRNLEQTQLNMISELVSARNRIKQLESELSIELKPGRNKEQQYLTDELKAWKEMVEQQKAIMEKIRNELELQQKINSEKDQVIESLRSQSRSSIASIDNTEDDINTSDELDLNQLFVESQESDDNDIELIEAIEVKRRSARIRSNNKKSPDIAIQEVWSHEEDYFDRNCVSDVSVRLPLLVSIDMIHFF